jgi:hypothetical protein
MTYISKVDASAPGGLKAVGAPVVSEVAKGYQFGGS